MFELFNPEIIETEGSQYGVEGCLSVPGYCGYVERPMRVRVKAFDRYGNPFEAHLQEDLTPDSFAERYPGFRMIYRPKPNYAYYAYERRDDR